MKVFVATMLLLSAVNGRAQSVYRCGNVYQDRPCPDAMIVDAEPNRGVEVRNPAGTVIHSRAGDKARNERTLDESRENTHNAFACAIANDQPKIRNGRIDCATVKAQRDAQRLTPEYIRK